MARGTGMRRLSTVRVSIAALAIVSAAGCSATYRNHGYVPSEEQLSEIAVGVDTRATVDDVLGAPSSQGVLEGGDYYYVRSRVRHFGMFEPKIVDRQVLAIRFDESDVVKNVERFGLEDGRVVPLTRRVTDSPVSNTSFLRQLLGNLGRFNPNALLNNN